MPKDSFKPYMGVGPLPGVPIRVTRPNPVPPPADVPPPQTVPTHLPSKGQDATAVRKSTASDAPVHAVAFDGKPGRGSAGKSPVLDPQVTAAYDALLTLVNSGALLKDFDGAAEQQVVAVLSDPKLGDKQRATLITRMDDSGLLDKLINALDGSELRSLMGIMANTGGLSAVTIARLANVAESSRFTEGIRAKWDDRLANLITTAAKLDSLPWMFQRTTVGLAPEIVNRLLQRDDLSTERKLAVAFNTTLMPASKPPATDGLDAAAQAVKATGAAIVKAVTGSHDDLNATCRKLIDSVPLADLQSALQKEGLVRWIETRLDDDANGRPMGRQDVRRFLTPAASHLHHRLETEAAKLAPGHESAKAMLNHYFPPYDNVYHMDGATQVPQNIRKDSSRLVKTPVVQRF